MTVVGDKQLLDTETLLLGDDEIAAQSQARNSAARIVVLGAALLVLLVLVGIALFVRAEMVRDLLWASVALIAYIAGSA